MAVRLNKKELEERRKTLTPYAFAELVLQNDLLGVHLNDKAPFTMKVAYDGREVELKCAKSTDADDISLHRVEVPFMALCLAVCKNPKDAYRFYVVYKNQWRPEGSDLSYQTNATSEFRSGRFRYHLLRDNFSACPSTTASDRLTFESAIEVFCEETEGQINTLIIEDFFRQGMDSLTKIHEECQLQIEDHQTKMAQLVSRKREVRQLMKYLVDEAPQSIKKELHHTKRFRAN